MTRLPPPVPADPGRAYDPLDRPRPPRGSGLPGWAVILIAGACLAFGFFLGLISGIGLIGWADGPDDIDVAGSVPIEAVLGEPFDITLEVANHGDGDRRLHCIDFADAYLDGFDVVSVDPSHSRIESAFGLTSYYFSGESIGPGGTRTVTITLRPSRVGTFAGDIDTCIDNDFNFVTCSATTRVVADR